MEFDIDRPVLRQKRVNFQLPLLIQTHGTKFMIPTAKQMRSFGLSALWAQIPNQQAD